MPHNHTRLIFTYNGILTRTTPVSRRLVCSPKLTDSIDTFDQMYPNEDACITLIHKLRWPAGFRCPRCEHTTAYKVATRRLPLFECHNCRHQASLTAGTVMHKSRTPLRKWLLTMYIVAVCDESINAAHLAVLLSVTYKTSWAMLNKIRHFISEADRKTLLSGKIEAKLQIYRQQFLPGDEWFRQEKPTIIARTMPTQQPSYFKIKYLERECPARTNLTPHDFNSFAMTHASTNLSYAEVNYRYKSPYKCRSVLAQTSRLAFQWLYKTFHGLSTRSLQPYLDEFCFRLNYPVDGIRCPFEYLLQLGLKAIHINEPTNHFNPDMSCKIVAA